MRFSVLIVTYNRKPLLLRCLSAVMALDWPDFEVVVVDDGSTDGTAEAVRRASPEGRCIVHPFNRGEPAGRNTAVRAATGEILAFADDDCLPPRDWLRRHAAHYADSRIAAVGGPQICASPNFLEQFDTVRYQVRFKTLKTVERIEGFAHLSTGNMSVRREVLERVGGFDEAFITGCDSDFVRRLSGAGYSFVRDPELTVEHLRKHRFGSYLRMRFHRGCGSVLTDVKEGTLALRRFFPLPDLRGVLEHWGEFKKAYGGGGGRLAAFVALAGLARCADVLGRGYYYWAVGRHYRLPPSLPTGPAD